MNIVRIAAIEANVRNALIAAQIKQPSFSFDRTNPDAQEWADAESAQLIKEITKETRETVRAILSRAFRDGLTPKQQAQLIKELVGLHQRQALAVMSANYRLYTAKPGARVKLGNIYVRVPKKGFTNAAIEKATAAYAKRLVSQRAMMIARTETIAASNEGQRQSWKQAVEDGHLSGDELRVWITTETACPICKPLNGQKRGIDVPFDTSLGKKMGPPAHPQCRCAQGLTAA